MKHSSYHVFNSADIQIGVGIQRDEVGGVFYKIGISDKERKGVALPVDEADKVDEYASFAFISDIFVFGF